MDSLDKIPLDNFVDLSLNLVEDEWFCFLMVLRQFQDRSTKKLILMVSSNHNVVQITMQTLVVDDASPSTKVVLKDTVGTCEGNAQEFEVWKRSTSG